MIKVKHLMDPVEEDDGQRMWVESNGLTKDLREWCHVDHILPHLGPPADLADWFEQHPDGFDYFRAQYHTRLGQSPYKPALRHMAKAAANENFTLLHAGEDPEHNAAVALHQYLSELGAWSAQEG
jgi:uncharacterized protein YeaO (DUF488 family)